MDLRPSSSKLSPPCCSFFLPKCLAAIGNCGYWTQEVINPQASRDQTSADGGQEEMLSHNAKVLYNWPSACWENDILTLKLRTAQLGRCRDDRGKREAALQGIISFLQHLDSTRRLRLSYESQKCCPVNVSLFTTFRQLRGMDLWRYFFLCFSFWNLIIAHGGRQKIN